MLSEFAQKVLDYIRFNGCDVEVSQHRGASVVSIFDPHRKAETCIGVTPDQQQEIFTRLALDYCDADQRAELVPSRHPRDFLLAGA